LGSTDVEALDLTSSPDPIANAAESEGLVEDGKSEVVVKVENAPLVSVKVAALEVKLTKKEDAQQNPPEAEPAATSFEFASLVVGRTYRLEHTEGKSKKFWEITINTQDATKYVTRYGKIGTSGQQQNKTCPNEVLCGREATKLVRDKLAKGYLSV
jgi:predicted DNA-binding WGR domain protein